MFNAVIAITDLKICIFSKQSAKIGCDKLIAYKQNTELYLEDYFGTAAKLSRLKLQITDPQGSSIIATAIYDPKVALLKGEFHKLTETDTDDVSLSYVSSRPNRIDLFLSAEETPLFLVVSILRPNRTWKQIHTCDLSTYTKSVAPIRIR